VTRRAERRMVALRRSGEALGDTALAYVNRLSDFLFVAARVANANGARDLLWRPGAHR
jgi:cob(I)alamin adenosyltransferase